MPSVERDIQKNVVDYARHRRCLALKVNVDGQRGWPDYLFITDNGEYFWIEFKKPGERTRKIQDFRIQEILARGADVMVVDNAEEGRDYVDYMVSA